MAREGVAARPGSGGYLVRAGVLAGLLSGLVGVGGGLVMVPALVSRRVRLAQVAASGTSLAAILPIAAVGTLTYGGHRDVDGFAILCVVPGSVVGAVAGARLARRVPGRLLAAAFALLALVSAVRLVIPSGLPSQGHAVAATGANAAGLLALGAGAGVLSGLLGIGGGIVLVPGLVVGFGLGQQLAQGTSLGAIIPTGLGGAMTHLRMGTVARAAAVALAAGGVVGAVAGALLAVHLPQTPLRILFAAYVGVTGVRVGLQALRAPR